MPPAIAAEHSGIKQEPHVGSDKCEKGIAARRKIIECTVRDGYPHITRTIIRQVAPAFELPMINEYSF
jgi:hypothetical protein